MNNGILDDQIQDQTLLVRKNATCLWFNLESWLEKLVWPKRTFW